MHIEHEHKFGLGDRVRVTASGLTGEVIGLDCYGRLEAHYRVTLDPTNARVLDQTWIYVESSLELVEAKLTPEAEIEAVVGAAIEMFQGEVEHGDRDESDSAAADLAAVVVYQLARDYDLDLGAMAHHVQYTYTD